ncbi:hypothetical protein N7481_013341 [Penicillium waksmanii]|uniref:uncharacterized protein n=1 Tax=Penicillium waksmanii TaxID=69791 RepID=UPI002548F95B|nr:uncharacterized protein N7481_013341 [Penicillium waksmanii]KAJ5966627.1 hypothetical protein N7481_013341 [Penicillium waksmanii]
MMTRIPFETIGQFEELGQTAIPNSGSFSLLLLRGYPCAKWLNVLGARFGIDPEFFRRHLLFASRPGRKLLKPAATQRRPSFHSDMLSLQVTTMSLQNQDKQMKHQKELDTLRKESFKQISTYTSNLALLNSSDKTAGDSFAREFSVHDLDCFSLEQSISIYIPSASKGRLGIVWHDGLRQLGDELKWPWQTGSSHTNTILKYLPKPLHNPGISSNSRRTLRNHPQSAEPSATADIILRDYTHIDLSRAVHDPLYALSPFFNLAVASEMAILDILDTKIREELNHSHLIGNSNPTLSNLLYHQQVLGRHIRNLKETIDAIESRYERSIPGNAPDSEVRASTTRNVESILGDYRAALTYAETLAAECVQGMTITAHTATIRESEKAVVEAQSVTKLTKLAVFFVPLSFVASLFGMNVREVNPGSTPPFWSWAVASLAVGAITWALLKHDEIEDLTRRAWRSCTGGCIAGVHESTLEPDHRV